MKLTPHSYQQQGISHCLSRYAMGELGAGIFGDPGVGKTVITLSVLKALGKRRSLIIAPLRVCSLVWPGEVEKWEFGFNCSLIHGTPNKRHKALYDRNADLFLINPEGVPWLSKQTNLDFDVIVVDESTKFKNWMRKRTKALRGMLKEIEFRMILTGTPSPNTVLDLFSQAYILDDGDALGKTKTVFCSRFMHKGGFKGREWLPDSSAASTVEEALAPMVLRLDAKDLLDMPPVVIKDIEVQMPPKAHAAYSQVERELFAELDDGKEIIASTAGAKYSLCRQMANGGTYEAVEEGDLGPRKVIELHDAKVAAVVDLVDELHGKPLLVAFQFAHDAARLKRAFPDAPVIAGKASGGLSEDELWPTLQAWNAGKIPVLLGQPKAMAHGLNMQDLAQHICWFGLTDNLEDYIQFNGRIWRQGVGGTVFLYRVLARSTVDWAIRDRIENKATAQTAILDSIKKYRQEHRSRDDC